MALFNLTPASILANVNNAINFLSGTARADGIAIFDQQTLRQVFETARPIKVETRETSKAMEYPVEDGATLSDHLVNLPTGIEFVFFIESANYTEAYGALHNARIRATLLALQTRTGVYSNMIITEMGGPQEPDMYDAIMLTVRFKEVLFKTPNTADQVVNYNPLDPVMSNTIQRGLQIGSSVTKQVAQALAFVKAGKIFGVRL